MTGEREPQAVLFDLDGTLADTAPDLAHALNHVRGEDGLEPLPFSAIRPHVSHGSAALIRIGFDYPQTSAAFEQRRLRLLERYRAHVADATTLFPGMDEVLARIEASARPWGVVTNKPGWLTTPLLRAIGLERRAACVVSGDTTARRKPHPEPLLAAAAALGLAPAQCLYVGDAERDVTAARAAGMPVLVARYGYIDEHEDPDAWGGCGTLEAPAELLAWL